MDTESFWLLIAVIPATQIPLVLITAIVAVECVWLLIIEVDLIDYQVGKIGIGLCFYFR